MKKIALIGAFDRFNYGDLLMPIIFEKQIESKNIKMELDYFAYKKSNMIKFGAYKTKKIKELKKMNFDTAIFIGGDMFPVTYINAFMDLQNNKIKIILYKILKKIIGIKNFELFCKKKLNGETNHPWVYSKEFLNVKKVIYNTVGGEIGVIDSELEKNLKNIDYISLRDKKSFENFNYNKDTKKLYPDSVIALSQFFDNNELNKLISNKTRTIENKIDGEYFVLQTNKYIGSKYYDYIIKQIEEIYNKYKLKCLLLPIGYANNHEDNIILKKIYKKVKVPIFMAEKGSVYDIIYNIKNAKFYVGTSLHGIITATSYEVPHFAYTDEIKKAINFEKTWNTTPVINCNKDNITEKYEEMFSNKDLKDLLEKNKKNLINLVNENFNNIFKSILDGEENE